MIVRTLMIVWASVSLAMPAVADAALPKRETARQVYRHAIPNIEGKSLIVIRVDYAPGAKSVPHRHPRSAFVYAYVLSGAIRSQVDDEPTRVYRAGESWIEAPGARHRISENASTTEPAQLLAVFVVDTDDRPLITPISGSTGNGG